MTDYSECNMEQLAVHHVGNKANEEELHLSHSALHISDNHLEELLIQFFLKPFSDTEFYNLSFPEGGFEMNPLYNPVKSLFDDPDSFHSNSIKIAKHLFEITSHPNIKAGDLFIGRFTDVQLFDELTDVIGIFKVENKQNFLKLDHQDEDFLLNYDEGINPEKLDKGCLIFNTDQKEGYKVTIIDKSNRSIDAQYWKDTFLNLKPCNDDYHATREFMDITKTYLTKQVAEEFDVDKTDQIDMMNRSVDYFKSNESFNKEEFEDKVFDNPELKESFRSFDNAYRSNNEIALNENFEISPQAVKKQANIFKSVLKLDKNFHIYIHGDRNKIEQGVDENGQKYYKIYYDEEK